MAKSAAQKGRRFSTLWHINMRSMLLSQMNGHNVQESLRQIPPIPKPPASQWCPAPSRWERLPAVFRCLQLARSRNGSRLPSCVRWLPRVLAQRRFHHRLHGCNAAAAAVFAGVFKQWRMHHISIGEIILRLLARNRTTDHRIAILPQVVVDLPFASENRRLESPRNSTPAPANRQDVIK
jgi:hypothetical protein